MFPDNLTRAEAQARSALLETAAYRVLVDLGGSSDVTFGSVSTVIFRAREAGTTHLDLIADSVISATLDGVALDPATFADSRLPLHLQSGTHELTVEAVCRFSRAGEGLHRFVDPADGRSYLYTQFEPADARRMYGCFEQPDLKATFSLEVIAPQSWTVVSCGAESSRTPYEPGNTGEGDEAPIRKGLARWRFAATPRISTYLTALVAGEYHQVPGTIASTAGDLPASLLCRQSLVPHLDAERLFATTSAGFAVFEEHFGYPYPFGKYDQAFVPEYNGGAMENVGCVTLRDEYLFRGRVTAATYQVRADTVLHELSHMWFGDLVTMTWWDDLWLKESFATWASHFAVGETGSPEIAWAAFCNALKSWAYRQDQLPSTHPVAADMVDLEAVELNFDGITYAKGASVLVQLVAFVGRDAFLAGLRDYFAKHAYGNTELFDLLRALENASSRDLSGWSAQWLEAAGVNTLWPDYRLDEDGRFTGFVIGQRAPEQWPTLRDHRVAIGLYERRGGALIRTRRLEVDIAGASTPVPALSGVARPDLLLINDDDLTYAKLRLDDHSLHTLIAHVEELASPLARAVCWGAAWDMCRDGELRAADYVAMALRGLAVETDLTAMTSVLLGALKAAADYTPLEQRPTVLRTWHDGLIGLVRAAEAGSDRQLALVRACAAATEASDADGVAELADWLNGRRLPDGLALDQDLRWILVYQLARLGAIGADEIAAEADRDRTIAGAEQAAAARAARPSVEAKAEAWSIAVERDDVPNGTQRAVCRAFWQRGQDAVLTPYVDRYLAAAAAISANSDGWAAKGPALRANVLRDLFPTVADLRPMVDRLDTWLAGHTLADFAARIVGERRDDTVRALHCQQA